VKNVKIQLLTDLLDLELFLEDSGRQDEDFFGVEVITKDKITLFSNFRRRSKIHSQYVVPVSYPLRIQPPSEKNMGEKTRS